MKNILAYDSNRERGHLSDYYIMRIATKDQEIKELKRQLVIRDEAIETLMIRVGDIHE